MTNRERILAASVALLLLMWGGSVGLGKYRKAVSDGRQSLMAARQQLAGIKVEVARGTAAAAQFQKWQEQSLPSDPQLAQARYRTWLLERLQAAGLTGSIGLLPNSSRSDAYQSIAYEIRADGDIAAVTSFLFDFYRSDQLQKITSMLLHPQSGSSQLQLTLNVEAIIVNGTPRVDKLSQGVNDQLALAGADEYRESIVQRNVFEVYKPAAESPPVANDGAPKKADEAAQAFVTFIQSGKKPQVWVTLRNSGQVLRLREGDRIRIGRLFGRVDTIADREVVVELDRGRLRVALGHHFGEGKWLEDEEET